MLYNEKTKNVQMKDFFNDLNSVIINEKKETTRLIIINDSCNEEDFTSENEQNDK
jgi:hypothetical protein